MNPLPTILATYAPTRPAIRLTHRGALLPCMDRDDLGFALAEYAAANGPALGAVLARNVMRAW